jgi:hypothetical protein
VRRSPQPAEVPVEAVDSIIRREYSERGQGYTLYIINPQAVTAVTASAGSETRAFRLRFISLLAPPSQFICVRTQG